MTENEWIKDFFTADFISPDLTNIESVKNFAILWNLFERYFCDKNANLKKIQDNINKLSESNYSFPQIIYDDYYTYCRKRYLIEDKTNELFESLLFRENAAENKYKELLKSILENSESESKKKVFACFIIIYRLRNNLFHGSKNIATIDEQNDNFERANKVLMTFLSFLKSSGKLIDKI